MISYALSWVGIGVLSMLQPGPPPRAVLYSCDPCRNYETISIHAGAMQYVSTAYQLVHLVLNERGLATARKRAPRGRPTAEFVFGITYRVAADTLYQLGMPVENGWGCSTGETVLFCLSDSVGVRRTSRADCREAYVTTLLRKEGTAGDALFTYQVTSLLALSDGDEIQTITFNNRFEIKRVSYALSLMIAPRCYSGKTIYFD